MSASLLALAERVTIGTPGQRAYLRYLAKRSNYQDGQCNPRVATIQRDLGCSERTARGRRRFWERLGALEVEHRGWQRASQYNLRADRLEALTVAESRRQNCPSELPLRNGKIAPQNAEKLPPYMEPRESNQGDELREPAPQAATPAPVSSSSVDLAVEAEGKQASGRQQGGADRPEPPQVSRSARRTPLPDDWSPPPEVRDLAIEAGYDPDEIMEEIADWCRDRDHRSADWLAFARRWIRREAKFRRSGPAARSSAKPGKQDWLVAHWENRFAAGAAA